MFNLQSPMFMCDAYKLSHIHQYPEGTELVYSNWTPRSDRHASTEDGVVVFGIQAFLRNITEVFDETFFDLQLEHAMNQFTEGYKQFFGSAPREDHVAKIAALHELGHLPIMVKALPEGILCPIGVPMLTIYNTHPDFYWVTNFLETIMSTELWQPMTSATIAREYYKILKHWSDKTCDNDDHIPFQAHDFSMRGMGGLESARASGAGHLVFFFGTDSVPAVPYIQHCYDPKPGTLLGTSIPATEHSVMSVGTKEDEIGTFKRLVTEVYPDGFVSIVSDTWDLWKVCTDYLPKLKDDIMKRDGKVVIRPDSGNPADIICGILSSNPDNRPKWVDDMITSEAKGVIELLWETFGGTVNSKGYKVLDPHIGAIYGDSITLDMAKGICRRLERKGFASSNIVFGVGSFTYQYNTRDTYGFAMKATYAEVNGESSALKTV
jgi:nicotinamide phosphoribosyltransferase